MALAGYAFREARLSLWRGRGAAAVAVLAIAAVTFVAGAFMLLSVNARRLVTQWSASAEMSVFLDDAAQSSEVEAVRQTLEQSGIAESVVYVSRDEALQRFRADFPGLAGLAGDETSHPLPASFDVELRPAVASGGVFDAWVHDLRSHAGVTDVRYDTAWLERLSTLVRAIESAALALVIVLGLAAALTVASVVRLAAAARSDEIDIMRLVGAPLATIRAPFLVEGALQGLFGALLALALLGIGAVAVHYRYGEWLAGAVGADRWVFLPLAFVGAIAGIGMLLGGVGGFIASRGAARP